MSTQPASVPSPRPFVASPRTLATLRLLAAAGGLTFLAGLFLAPQRVWGGYLMGFAFVTSLALAGPVFLAFLNLAGARWSAALQRVPEAMTAALPAAAVMGVVLIFGLHELYEWSHAAVVEHDVLLADKAVWLNQTGFTLRLLAVFALWIVLAQRLLKIARRYAQGADEPTRIQYLKTSVLFIAVVAVTFSVAAFDWLMSLEPHWFSTMFALMHFGGLVSAGLAAAILLVLALERQGALAGVLRDAHLHDLGKLLFCVTLFWAYCWYCQHMLIWYTDIPEETTHYVVRQQGSWWLLVQATLVLQWGVPFVALMSRRACRQRSVLGRVAAVVLVGHALELYVQVGPPLMGEQPVLGLWELGPLIGALALFFLVVLGALGKSPVVHGRHPHLSDSLAYETP